MPADWTGTAAAISLMIIAATYVVVGAVVVLAARAAGEQSKKLGAELAHLREDLAPTLSAVNRLSEKGLDVAELAEAEVREIIATTRQIRGDVQHGVNRAKRRLADFEATVEVVQEEIDSAVVEVSAALETARAGAGMIGQLRRLIRPRRRGSR